MKKIFLFIYIPFFSLLTSCTEKWLELEPQGEILEANFYKNDEQTEQGLMGAYAWLRCEMLNQPPQAYSSPYWLMSIPGDDSFAGGQNLTDLAPIQELDVFEFTSESPTILYYWQRTYFGINRANLVIENPDYESDYLAEMKAEAKFLRAYYYFELIRMFGDVPMLTKAPTPNEYFTTERKPVAEIYTQIIKDLRDAMAVLPYKSERESSQLFRADKGAAMSLLGKVYVFMASPYYNLGTENYSYAANVLDSVIASGEYDLELNYDDIWQEKAEHGIESIFEIEYSPVSDILGWWHGLQASGNVNVQMSGPRVSLSTDTLARGWGFDIPTTSLMSAYDAAGDAVRKEGTCLTMDFINSTGGSVDQAEIPPTFSGAYSKKRTTWLHQRAETNVEWRWGTNERMIRFADVLLLAAEAHNRTGNNAKAIEYIERVRIRAQLTMDGVPTGGDELYEAIKNERRLELALEGHRFHDLIRWNDAEAALVDQGFVEGKNNVFPIPASEIISSKESLIQNNGY